MKLPGATAFLREGLLVVGGAIVGALIIRTLPGLRDWIAAQWSADD